ncbi:MAG: sensor histidine kinase [Candidatus Tectimicrobiota bacterium]
MWQRVRQWLLSWQRRARVRPGMRGQATRHLRLLLCTSLLLLSLPLTLLLQRVYQQLAREVIYQYRAAAEDVVMRINQRLADVLQSEEQRPFDEYSFLRVTANPLFKASAIEASPLSALPPQSALPGVLGYFQINPDGSLQSPVLPDLEAHELAANVERFGFGADELSKRLALRSQLAELLLAGTPVTERRRRQRTAVQQAPPPAAASKAPASFREAIDQEASAEKQAGRADQLPKTGAGTAGSELAEKRQERTVTPGVPELESPAPLPTPLPAPQKLSPSRVPSYRERRKEQVALPEQSTVSQVQGALDKLAARAQDASPGPATRHNPAAPPPEESASSKSERTVKILTFEGEVDPLQCTVLGAQHLVFFRKAWRNNLRYIQGFVVDRQVFLGSLMEGPLSTTVVGQHTALRAQVQETLLYSRAPLPLAYNASPDPGLLPQSPTLLYQAFLEAPLEAVSVTFHAFSVPRSPGAPVVDALAVTLLLVLLASHYGLYRLGLQQIALAAQRSDFVAAVSHELRTPLTAIRMYGEMLRAGWVQDETRRQSYYDFIFFESERLSRLISNVLQLARLTNQDAPLALQSYPLSQLLDVVRSKISTQAEAAGFELHFLVSDPDKTLSAATVLADEDAFVQICINLVDNALKFSAQALTRRVDVGVRPWAQAGEVVVFVRDYGPGVAPEQMQRIFQLFYRVENALTRQTRGTGIGLALVKALASKMQARVDLQNCQPGAEFQLILPLLPAD